MSYDRMKEQEKLIRAQAKEMLARAEATDDEEDATYGKDKRGDELPAELQRRETRLKRIREAKKAVEERARQKAAAEGKPAEEIKPDAKAQYNFTDPESRIMKSNEGFVQAYNAQIVVEPDFQLIVGPAVTQAANDKEQVAPMIVATEVQSGQRPQAILADSGYCSEKNLEYLESAEAPERRIAAYVTTGRQKHGERPLAQSWGGNLRGAQSDRRTRVRANQASPRIPALLAARPEKGTLGMGLCLPQPQHIEVVPDVQR